MSTATVSSFQSLQNHFNSAQAVDPSIPHLGDIVFWALHDAEMNREELTKVWVNAGLNTDLLPPAQTASKALRQAVRAVGAEHGKMLRAHPETDVKLVYSVVAEIFERGADEDPEYTALSRFGLDKVSGTLHGDVNDLTFQQVKTEFDRFMSVVSSREIMTLITTTLKSFAAIALRDSGGVYWVPRTYSAQVRCMQTAIEQVGKSRVFLLPVYDSVDACKTLQASAKASLDFEVSELTKQIDEFKKEGCRPSTLHRRLADFDELRAKAHLYGGILRVTNTDLETAITTLENTVNDMLTEIETAKILAGG